RSAASPEAILCEGGASMIALATDGSESTSPRPTSPSSVWTRTTSPSWLPSPIDVSIAPLGRSNIASTLVIRIALHRSVGWLAIILVEVLPAGIAGRDRAGAALEHRGADGNEPVADPASRHPVGGSAPPPVHPRPS